MCRGNVVSISEKTELKPTLWMLANGRILYRKTMSYFSLRTQPNPWISLRICSEHSLIQIAFNFTQILCLIFGFSLILNGNFVENKLFSSCLKKHFSVWTCVSGTHKICFIYVESKFSLYLFFLKTHTAEVITSSCLDSKHKSRGKYLKWSIFLHVFPLESEAIERQPYWRQNAFAAFSTCN